MDEMIDQKEENKNKKVNDEPKNFFSEYDKSQILNNQITATLNLVPFELIAYLHIDGELKPEYYNFF